MGRSPRGAYATPARFADAMLADELGERGADAENPMPTGISLAALPPGFHAFAAKMNEANSQDDENDVDEAVTSGRKTASGIPLPFADPAVGAGLFPERVLKVHSERIDGMPAATKKEDTIRLLSKMQLLDVSDIAILGVNWTVAGNVSVSSGPIGISSSVTIPEPATVVIGVLGFSGMACRARDAVR